MNKVNSTILAATRPTSVTTRNDEQVGGANAAKHPAGPAKASGAEAPVQLSATASEATSAEAPVDRGRVEAIRSAIASGNYPVDAAAIAGRILAFERG